MCQPRGQSNTRRYSSKKKTPKYANKFEYGDKRKRSMESTCLWKVEAKERCKPKNNILDVRLKIPGTSMVFSVTEKTIQHNCFVLKKNESNYVIYLNNEPDKYNKYETVIGSKLYKHMTQEAKKMLKNYNDTTFQTILKRRKLEENDKTTEFFRLGQGKVLDKVMHAQFQKIAKGKTEEGDDTDDDDDLEALDEADFDAEFEKEDDDELDEDDIMQAEGVGKAGKVIGKVGNKVLLKLKK
jgi:hypothetical protein